MQMLSVSQFPVQVPHGSLDEVEVPMRDCQDSCWQLLG